MPTGCYRGRGDAALFSICTNSPSLIHRIFFCFQQESLMISIYTTRLSPVLSHSLMPCSRLMLGYARLRFMRQSDRPQCPARQLISRFFPDDAPLISSLFCRRRAIPKAPKVLLNGAQMMRPLPQSSLDRLCRRIAILHGSRR